MLRLVRAPDGRIVPDMAGDLPGAALEIAASRAALETSGEAVAETFGPDAYLPDDLAAMVEKKLVARIQNWISLARKSGDAVCGFAKVEEGMRTRRGVLVLQAHDAGKADAAKMLEKAEKCGAEVAVLLSRAELGKPFARAEAVHVLLQESHFSAEIIKEMRRLAGFRQEDAL